MRLIWRICLSSPTFVALEWNVTEIRQVHLNLTYILSTDKRTDVWSRDFIIWKINSGLWAVVWDGLWNKRVWADYEQLLRPVFSRFWGQKFFFWKPYSVLTEKLHKIKINFFDFFSETRICSLICDSIPFYHLVFLPSSESR